MSIEKSQTWNPQSYAKNAGFVSQFGEPVLEQLDPKPKERILDLGCGDGSLMKKLVDLGCEVYGVDSSPDMIAQVRSQGLLADVMSGEALTFDAEFDAVFSNAALHWMLKPQAVIEGVWRSLKPGGRFVGEFGGAGNVAKIVAALTEQLQARGYAVSHPWYFPQPEDYRKRLIEVGFQVLSMEHFERPTPLPGDVGGWIETFAHHFTQQLPQTEQAEFITDVVDVLRPQLYHQGQWSADYVRLRFAALKPQYPFQS